MYMYNLQHGRFSVEQLIHACVYKTVTMNGVVHDIENVLLVSLPSHTAGVIFYIYIYILYVYVSDDAFWP